MDLITILQVYIATSISIAWTSYITLYRPSIELTEEIVGERTIYGGISGFFIWSIFGFILAPWIGYYLLRINNKQFKEEFAVKMAELVIKNEEDE